MKELNKELDGFEPEVIDMFIKYNWPGNLREFRNVIRRCALLTASGNITASSLPYEISSSTKDAPVPVQVEETKSSQPDLKVSASKAEYDIIMNVLKDVNFNKTKAAEVLKIDRKTLYNKIKSYEDSQS